jgi:hypothetical protein
MNNLHSEHQKISDYKSLDFIFKAHFHKLHCLPKKLEFTKSPQQKTASPITQITIHLTRKNAAVELFLPQISPYRKPNPPAERPNRTIKSPNSPCCEGRTQLSSHTVASARSIGSCREREGERERNSNASNPAPQTNCASSRRSRAYGLAGIPRAGDGVGGEEVRGEVKLREAGVLQLDGDEELVGDAAGARHRR